MEYLPLARALAIEGPLLYQSVGKYVSEIPYGQRVRGCDPPNFLGSVDHLSTCENTRECRVTRHFSRIGQSLIITGSSTRDT